MSSRTVAWLCAGVALAGATSRARGDDHGDDHGDGDEVTVAARLACDHLELARPIVFRHDWELEGWSRPALDGAAALLIATPSIRRVRVEADDLWNDPARGARVSHNRADAVLRYLVARGVAADRLEARGFGAERVDERSGAPAGVRLVVVDPAPACPAPAAGLRDDDRDGLALSYDRCPDVAEDLDGVDDGDGCPEPAGGHVRVECRDVVLDGPVRLSARRLTLDARSRGRVEALAALLVASPWLRLVLVEERVHHDPRRPEIPPARRAPAIVDRLVALGVTRDRLLPVLSSRPSMPAGRYELTFRVFERSVDCPAAPAPPTKPTPTRRRRR